MVKLAYKSVGNFKKNPNIVQSSSIAVPGPGYEKKPCHLSNGSLAAMSEAHLLLL